MQPSKCFTPPLIYIYILQEIDDVYILQEIDEVASDMTKAAVYQFWCQQMLTNAWTRHLTARRTSSVSTATEGLSVSVDPATEAGTVNRKVS